MIQNDWIINDNNIFGLQKNITLALCTIQYEIILQLDNKIINSFSSYLKININTTKYIKNTQNLNIDILFKDYLGLDSFNQLKQKEVNCWVCLSYFQILLLKEYNNEKHKNILTFSEYEIQYNSLLESYLNSNIDTDEMDFVKSEQSICKKLLLELNKPVYYEFNISNEVLSTPCLFKVNLSNSIDKRQKFLNDIANKKLLIINKNHDDNKEATTEHKSKKALSFKYIKAECNGSNLSDMMTSLKDNNFIHKNTTLPNFRKVFEGKEIVVKIIWTGNVSELHYFIKYIHNIAKKVHYTKQNHWTITINCFEMQDGTILTNDKLKGQKKPAAIQKIENAVNLL